MKKITSILSLAAIVVSALCMSCAKSKTPDVIVAFPTNKYASYVCDENGAYTWDVESQYRYQPYGTGSGSMASSSPKAGGFDVTNHEMNYPDAIVYWFEPNTSWTAEVVGAGKEYIQLSVGPGYKPENQQKGDIVSGVGGWIDMYIEVISVPHLSVGAVECVIELEMGGQRMPIATINIDATETALSVYSQFINLPCTRPNDNNVDQNNDYDENYPVEYRLNYTIDRKINKTIKPEISINNAPWLKAQHIEGADVILISCAENKAQTEREAIITLTYPATDPNVGPLEVSVMQEAAPAVTPENPGGNTGEGGNTDGGNTDGGNTEGETTLTLTLEGSR